MIDAIDSAVEAIAFLLCGDDTAPKGNLAATAPDVFDGFEPLSGPDFLQNDEGIHIADHAADQPVWPMRSAWAVRFDDAKLDWQIGTWQFFCVQTLRPQKYRPHVQRWFPKMAEIHCFTTEPMGKSAGSVHLVGLTKVGALPAGQIGWGGIKQDGPDEAVMHPSMYGRRGGGDNGVEPSLDLCVRVAAGIALRRRYYWSVLISEGNGPRARISTDPIGVREIFALRDVEPGRARRLALLHWVRRHRRQRRVDPDAAAWVRQHLRGNQEFVWNGLRVRVEPSHLDAEASKQPTRIADR